MNAFISSLSAYKNSHLIGFMGQSNCNGQSNSMGTYPTAPPDPNTYLPSSGQYIFDPVAAQWQPLQQNLNNSGAPVTPFLGYIGFEMKLMELLQAYYGTDQYMVKYAQGGTSLATDSGTFYNWSPASTDPIMYYGCVANYLSAMASFPVQPMKMKVLIWTQGESDTTTIDANAYQANFTDFITALKNAWNLPNLLVLQTGLADTQTAFPNKSIINTAKINLSVGGNKYVSTDGAQVASDGAHFTVAGYEDIAQRVFDVLITML